jgi:hypothetical protein
MHHQTLDSIKTQELSMENKTALLGLIVLGAVFIATAFSPNTSLGINPVWAAGGNLSSGNQTIALMSAPSNQDLLVTDVVFSITGSGNGSSSCTAIITLQDSNSISLGGYRVASRDNVNYGGGISPTTISHTYRAGLPVSAGTSLDMVVNTSCGGLSYSVSGVHVQP